MIHFLRTRTRMQWLAAFGWLVFVVLIVGGDYANGHPVTAMAELAVWSGLFVFAAWLGHKSTAK